VYSQHRIKRSVEILRKKDGAEKREKVLILELSVGSWMICCQLINIEKEDLLAENKTFG